MSLPMCDTDAWAAMHIATDVATKRSDVATDVWEHPPTLGSNTRTSVPMSVHWGAMSVAMLIAMRLQRTNIGTNIAWKLTDVATDMAEHCETDHPLPANIATDIGKCVSDVATDVGATGVHRYRHR